MHMWGWNYSMGWPMALWMILIVVGGLVLLALLIWAVARRTRLEPVRNDTSAMEILRARYARGEVDGATFEEMRERLETAYK
jgi:putative membrane protein